MKVIHLIAAMLLSLGMSAQNWNNSLPAVTPNHIHRFYNDTATGRLIGTGAFDSAGSVAVPGIAAWDGTTWSSIGTGMPNFSSGSSILCALRYSGDLFFGGYIPDWSSNYPYIFKWNGITLDSFAVINASPYAMLQYENDLVVSGGFTMVDNVPVNCIARWDGTNWSDLGFGNFYFGVRKMIAYHGDLYAIGMSNTDYKYYVFRLVNNNTWQIVGQSFSGAGNGLITDVCIYNDELYVCGQFSTSTNPPSGGNSIAKLDTISDTWTNVGGGLTATSNIPSIGQMVVHNGGLYVSGWPEFAGGVNAPYIARWDGTQWCGFNVGLTDLTFAMADFNNSLYISTGSIFNNNPTNGFAMWIGGNYTDTCGVVTTGLNEQTQQTFSVSVFPNPVNTNATFQIIGLDENKTLIIFDQFGKEIWRKETTENLIEFSAQNFAAGLYFYRVEDKNGKTSAGKFIIQ